MGELSLTVLLYTILFIAVPMVFGFIALRLKIPALVGYMVGGIVLGSFIHEGLSEVLSMFASVGLILLLFTIGLEIDLTSLRRFSRFVLLGGLVQIILTALFVYGLSLLFGFSFITASIIGLAFALSSTAVVSKIIQERGEDNSLTGQLALGILILQDIVAIPLLVIVSSYKPDLAGFALVSSILLSLVKSGLVIAVMYTVGLRVIPPIFEYVGKISRELLNLFVLLFVFLAVYVFSLLGLSASLAAFVAGTLVGQTLSHYHIFSQMRPLRDLFLILFFVFLGASVEPSSYISSLLPILAFTGLFITAKFIVVLLIFIYFRFHTKTSYVIGILLCQVGEFAFILIHQSRAVGLINTTAYSFALSVTLFSLIISPLLIEHKERIYTLIRGFIKKRLPFLENYLTFAIDREPAHIEAFDMKDHIILCGYGRVGKYIGRALTMASIPYIAIDYNYHTIEDARKKGVMAIYGDPTDIDILDYAQAEDATSLISAVPDSFSQEMIILNARLLNSKIVIFTRVDKESQQQRMKDLGAHVVIQPEFEAALSIVKRIFTGYHLPKSDIAGKIKRLKIEHGMG